MNESTEKYYIDQDEFVRYITGKVNPARKKEGLKEVGIDEARLCYRIIIDFQSGWLKP